MPRRAEKFWPVIVIVLPGLAFVALIPVTTGVRFTTSKSPAVSTFRPLLAKMSFEFHTRLI